MTTGDPSVTPGTMKMAGRSTKTLFLAAVLALNLLGTLTVRAETTTGTGFAVTFDGVVITNNHVVSQCGSQIKARIEGDPNQYYEAGVIARDADHDLAALRLQRGVGQGYQGPIQPVPRAIFRKTPPVQQGEKVITYGFPLRGLLATSGNLTVGYVSALRGIGDNPNYIQITAPVQPGNSGGPLLDGSGHVIGVIVAKLDAVKVMLAMGDVPQNVNFAVELSVLKHFLQQHNVQIVEEESKGELPLTEIPLKAKLSTYLIECETISELPDAPWLQSQPPAPPPVAPRYSDIPKRLPSEQQLVSVDLSKLKFSDIRRPYPSLYPETFEIGISNAGSDRV
jgi:hypothetical protein